jgi:hypothetical protein
MCESTLQRLAYMGKYTIFLGIEESFSVSAIQFVLKALPHSNPALKGFLYIYAVAI